MSCDTQKSFRREHILESLWSKVYDCFTCLRPWSPCGPPVSPGPLVTRRSDGPHLAPEAGHSWQTPRPLLPLLAGRTIVLGGRTEILNRFELKSKNNQELTLTHHYCCHLPESLSRMSATPRDCWGPRPVYSAPGT